MNSLAERIAELSPEKQALLQLQLRKQSNPAPRTGSALTQRPTRRRDSSAKIPLSYAQERLWTWEQLQPGSPAYSVLGAIRIRGALNREALERCLAEIVRRHEVLRTTF